MNYKIYNSYEGYVVRNRNDDFICLADTKEEAENIVTLFEKNMQKMVGIYDYGKACCPICKTDIYGIGKINYCFRCGQRLNWR